MNVIDSKGNTPFHYAVLDKNEEMIKTLMGYKANPFIRSMSNHLPTDYISDDNNILLLLNKYIDNF